MKSSYTVPAIIIAAIVVLLCCLCLAVIVAGGLLISSNRIIGATATPPFLYVNPTAETGHLSTVTQAPPLSAASTPLPPLARQTPGPGAGNTLDTLVNAEVPISSLIDLAGRLKGIQNIPMTETPPPAPLKIGETHTFWASNVDTNNTFKVDATLRSITPHLYFWVETGVSYDSQALTTLATTFENKIYPTDRQFFGSEWSPGVDDDVHLYILLARGLGTNLAGYYSSADEYDPKAHPYSNAHEMFLLNADNIGLSENFTYGVLAHEFQHMIHWYRDRNEESWMNEGFSEVAAFLNGYDVGGFDLAYISDTDLQLNDWPNDPNATTPHYGAGFLFLAYFLDRFGDTATKDLVGDPQNGLVSVDDILKKDGIVDKATGKPVTADDVFADWAVTNYVLDPKVGDGRYTYTNYPNAPQAQDTETISQCPTGDEARTVHQYGVDYIGIRCQGDFTLNFTGSTQVGVLAENAHSGSYYFWSNKGDESDMTLDHSFDFTNQKGPITLSYYTWYDIEKDYDYVYVEAKEANGGWKILKTPSGTDTNPSGNSYGWGYTGTTDGWIKETVDLSQFAGKQVDLRFEYITDAAVNGEGFLLDDVSIPEIGYQTDFEKDSGGWQAAGFVRIQNTLPQTYRLSLILKGNTTTVQPIELSADQTASIPLHIGSGVTDAVLVVSGTTRFTRQEANYEFSITK